MRICWRKHIFILSLKGEQKWKQNLPRLMKHLYVKTAEKKYGKLGYSCRNHCPYCLFSKHVDINPGDRSEKCHGLLEPIDIEINPKKGYVIVSKCIKCGAIRKNKMAEDDNMELAYELIKNKGLQGKGW